MNKQSILRYGGIAAILSAVLYILSLGISFSGSVATLGSTLYIASSLLFLPAIYALYTELRSETGLWSLVALILLGALTIWTIFLDPAEISPIFGPLTLAYGLGFILFGWLQRSSKRYPNGLAYSALATGIMAIVASLVLMASGSFDLFGVLNLALSIPYLIWLVWLGRQFVKGTSMQIQSI